MALDDDGGPAFPLLAKITVSNWYAPTNLLSQVGEVLTGMLGTSTAEASRR